MQWIRKVLFKIDQNNVEQEVFFLSHSGSRDNAQFWIKLHNHQEFMIPTLSWILRTDYLTFYLFLISLSCKSFPISLHCKSKLYLHPIGLNSHSPISSEILPPDTEETQAFRLEITSCWTKKVIHICTHPSSLPSEDKVSSPSDENQVLYLHSWFHPLPFLQGI